MGMMVAPGFSFSSSFCDVLDRQKYSKYTMASDTYLSRPPPLSGMHVEVYADSVVGVGIVTFRREDQ